MERFKKHADKLSHLQFGIECGPGWYDIIDRLLSSLSDDTVAVQIKEKFGILRCYIYGGTEEDYAKIYAAEAESSKTCEVCGEPGELTGKGWLSTLCPKCQATHV